MRFYPIELKTNYMKSEYAVADTQKPIFSWGAVHEKRGAYQSAFHICVFCGDELLWDSGFVASEEQKVVYGGKMLPSGAVNRWIVELKDNDGNISIKGEAFFKTACFDEWNGKWIYSPYEKGNEAQYFVRSFKLQKMPVRAVLYHCGLGLDKAYINGKSLDEFRLQPAFSNYVHESMYITSIIDVADMNIGENIIGITVAGGWRKNNGPYLDNLSEQREIEFMGNMCLNAQLVLYFDDGSSIVIATDTEWKCITGAITYSHLFDGEEYDEYSEIDNWNTCSDNTKFIPAELSDFHSKKLKAQKLEPVCVKREISPVCSYCIEGKSIYDFGENFSGVLKLKIKGKCDSRTVFKIRHAELTDERGDLYTAPLRGAKATDSYICKEGEHNVIYIPEFTYHGFRYASLEVEGDFEGSVEASALNFYTDIDTESFFNCGNPLVNEFYQSVIRTERSNLHSIASDCPQRDERMGWLNDATVRFMAMPNNFNAANLFEKIADDIANEQDKEGRITCTAPFVYGERPADPVCSSFLITAMEHYLMTGSTKIIEKHYTDFINWNNYLASRTDNGIVNYSYYGDWAGPKDCCYSVDTIGASDTPKLKEYDTDASNSIYIPGLMVSTGCHYMNYHILKRFAEILSRKNDAKIFIKGAEDIRKAFLEKWFDKTSGKVYNGSQACQAFALFIGVVPEEYEEKAAMLMNEAVVRAGYRLQTANITTPMLMNMLGKYGYIDTAWKLLTRTDYPSWGYMIANGATTIWERFELKKNCGMNSHNHPMYGAAVRWLYECLAGIRVLIPGKEYRINPTLPDGLKYFEMKIPTLHGYIYIKHENKYGEIMTFVDVPFGLKVLFGTEDKHIVLGSGFRAINNKDV